MTMEHIRPGAEGLSEVSRDVDHFVLDEVIKSKAYLDAIGSPKKNDFEDRVRGVNRGVKMAGVRIIQIQESKKPEKRAAIAKLNPGSGPWSKMLSEWDSEADPNGFALLERGITHEKDWLLILADMAQEERNSAGEQRFRTFAETIEAGHSIVVDFYRGLVEPQTS